jgi:UDP-N-acetylglucosamine 1-carboxyvinyltransferase
VYFKKMGVNTMSEALIVKGGIPLYGTIDIQGAKNSVLPILAATVLIRGESIIRNCPRLQDVDTSIRILKHLGCKAKQEGSTIVVDTSSINRFDIPDCLMREMRSSVVFLGAVLARLGQAVISVPGGCDLGPRPIDWHLDALRKLGAVITNDEGRIQCSAGKMTGTEIHLPFPSVGVTENVMMTMPRASRKLKTWRHF